MVFEDVPIEESVVLDRNYPSVSERYFTNYYFVPDDLSKSNSASGCEKSENGKNGSESMNSQGTEEEVDKENSNTSEGDGEKLPSPDKTGHTCIMVHTNKLCLLTLSHHHPVLAEKKQITDVSSWNFVIRLFSVNSVILFSLSFIFLKHTTSHLHEYYS